MFQTVRLIAEHFAELPRVRAAVLVGSRAASTPSPSDWDVWVLCRRPMPREETVDTLWSGRLCPPLLRGMHIWGGVSASTTRPSIATSGRSRRSSGASSRSWSAPTRTPALLRGSPGRTARRSCATTWSPGRGWPSRGMSARASWTAAWPTRPTLTRFRWPRRSLRAAPAGAVDRVPVVPLPRSHPRGLGTCTVKRTR